jgi:hypothetical protein
MADDPFETIVGRLGDTLAGVIEKSSSANLLVVETLVVTLVTKKIMSDDDLRDFITALRRAAKDAQPGEESNAIFATAFAERLERRFSN